MRSLKWCPSSFTIESPKLEPRIIEASVQEQSLQTFTANPRKPMTYVVAGNPDDREAKYFAAYLAQVHTMAVGLDTKVVWESITSSFENPAMQAENVSMLILTNLTPRSSNLKFEKTRDLLERHAGVPKVLVVAGEDPLSFAATRLHVPCHAIAYFGSKTSKTFNEVI
jgi:hypothetical protein